MKIILLHNKYQQAGGEDMVFQLETELLKKHGHQVKSLVFENDEIKTFIDKVLLGLLVVYNPWTSKRLKKIIQEFHPDLIHIHNFFPLASPSIFFTAKHYDIPVVVTLHNYRLICPSASLFHNRAIYERSINSLFPIDAILKGVYRNSRIQTAALVVATRFHNVIGTWKEKVDKFIVLTEFAERKFKNSIINTTPGVYVVKPNFVMDNGPGNNSRENFFLFIGRLTEDKGIEILLESIKLYNYKLFIIGRGPMQAVVEDVAKSNANLSYLGYQDISTIMLYLKKCKALIFPSIWYEGLPLTIIEAFSTGTPVIASRLGAMMEMVQDNENGLHFDSGSAADLVRKIQRMESHPDLVSTLSRNARTTYLNQYTPEKNYKLLLDIYSQMLWSRKGTRYVEESN